ncbi:MAG: hypothetical protein M3198_17250 [Actinomycetota bacterium]|nr:hypothetical protein [Actinomycetota bacterium]
MEFAHDWTGGGTTCGFLCHWLMRELGALGDNINITDHDRRLQYRDGENIIRLYNAKKRPFVGDDGGVHSGARPGVGDIVMIVDPDVANSEHVLVFMGEAKETDESGKETVYWRTAEAGRRNPDKGNRQSASEDKRRLFFQGRQAWLDRPVFGPSQAPKRIMGWVDLDLLNY